MSEHFTRSRVHEEIQKTLVAVSTELDRLHEDYACIVHCMQPRRSGFYRALESEFQVQVIVCGGDTVKAVITRIALGLPGVIVIQNYNVVTDLFGRVGQQAVAGLYAVKSSALGPLLDLAKQDATNLANLVCDDSSHFFYQVDEDAATADGLSLEIVSLGTDCPSSLKAAIATSATTPSRPLN